MFNPDEIYQKMIEAGEHYADTKAAYNALDRVTKSILAGIVNQMKEGSQTAKESLARCHQDYHAHLKMLNDAEVDYLRAQVKWVTLKELSDNRRTQESTRRAEMGLK